jgi:hypothetical protein
VAGLVLPAEAQTTPLELYHTTPAGRDYIRGSAGNGLKTSAISDPADKVRRTPS